MKPGEPLDIEGPGHLRLFLCPTRDANGARTITVRASESRTRVTITLERADVEALRQFCDVWLSVEESSPPAA